MIFDDFYKRFTAFGLAFAFSLFAAGFLYGIKLPNVFENEFEPAAKTAASKVNRIRNNIGGNGIGSSGGCLGRDDSQKFSEKTSKKTDAKPQPIKGVNITLKPRANYTDAARTNQAQGKVVLRVTFGANGQIGAISVVSGLPDGLTEQAIEAAKGIKFEPAKRGGVPYSVSKPVEYTFTIY